MARPRHALLLAISLAALTAGCGGSSPPVAGAPATVAVAPSAAPSAVPAPAVATKRTADAELGDWTLFGLTASRPNATNRATGVTARSLRRLRHATVRLPGTVDSSPIVLRGVRVGGAARDVAFATTTYGRTLAIDLGRARVLWTFTPPGYAGWAGSAQITNASPAADPSRRFVFTASPDGRVHKLRVQDGREAGGAWPVSVTRDATHEKLTSSFNVVGDSVVVTTGGYIGDAPPYQGHVVRIARATGKVAAVFNSLCSDRRELIQPSTCPGQASAIWGRSGAVLDPASGALLVASSNGPFDGRTNWSDSVLRLDGRTLALQRNWTPKDQARYEDEDIDVGSTSPVVLGDGLLLQSGKDALLHLLDARTLNGRTGPASARLGGELQDLPTPGRQQTFTAPAAWRHDGRTTAFVATGGGTAAYAVRGRRLHAVWANAHAGTSPVVAGGLLWVYDPTGGGLRVYDPASGRQLAVLPAGRGHWNSPVVTGGHVVLGEGDANEHAQTGALDVWSAR